MYVEQVGVNLQELGNKGESIALYTFTKNINTEDNIMNTVNALATLSKDAKLQKIIEKLGSIALPAIKDPYKELILSIICQQLSLKAGQTISERFLALFPDAYPHKEELLAFPIETLRAVGLSQQKAGYVQNVAAFFSQEKIENLHHLSDEQAIVFLTQIKGVGKWTAEMLLIFALGRADVFSLGDLALKTKVKKLYGLESEGKELETQVLTIAENWKPFRSLACLYLWKWDGILP